MTRKHLRLDIFTAFFVLMLTFGLMDDYCRLMSFLVSGDVVIPTVCTAIGFLLTACLCFSLRNKVELSGVLFSYWDFLMLAIIMMYLLIKIPFPDNSYDTQNGVIFRQLFAFTPKYEDMKPFLPVICAMYSLPDRVFFHARLLLGYRLSLLVYVPVLIASYYKAKQILQHFWQKSGLSNRFSKSRVQFLLALFAFVTLMSNVLISVITIFKGDAFILPLFLECLWQIVSNNELNNKHYIWGGLLLGFAISAKLTNIVFFLPLIVWIIVRGVRQKSIAPVYIFSAGAFAVFPVLPYLLYSLIFTGSPVFPFYNAIFKSPYYHTLNSKDPRWGPASLLEAFVWPITSFCNTTRADEVMRGIISVTNGRSALGFIFAFVALFSYRKTKLLHERLPLLLTILVSGFLWSATTGYTRYGLTLEVISFLFIIIWLFDMATLRKTIFIKAFIPLICMSVMYSIAFSFLSDFDWRPRPIMLNLNPEKQIKNLVRYTDDALANLKYLGRDRMATDDPLLQEKFDNVKTWICLNANTASAIIANPSADIFHYATTIDECESFIKNYLSNRDEMSLYSIEEKRNFTEDAFSRYELFDLVIVACEPTFLVTADATQTQYFLHVMTAETAIKEGLVPLTFESITAM